MLSLRITAILFLMTLASSSPTLRISQRTSSCATGVHFITARGSGATLNANCVVNLAGDLVDLIPGSDQTDLNYPANKDTYMSSESQGTAAMLQLIETYVQSCPNTKIVLIGYSQGAQVISDTLFGTSTPGWQATAPLPQEYGSHIAGVIQMGDPSHVAGQSYNAGTGTNSGVFYRPDLSQTATYASRIQSYCNDNDKWCDSGDSLKAHHGYVPEYKDVAIKFIMGLVGS